MIGFFTGYWYLGKNMHTKGKFTGKPLWRKCDLQEETARNLILKCERLDWERTETLGSLTKWQTTMPEGFWTSWSLRVFLWYLRDQTMYFIFVSATTKNTFPGITFIRFKERKLSPFSCALLTFKPNTIHGEKTCIFF